MFDRAGDPDDPPSFESRRVGFAVAGEWRPHWSVPAQRRPRRLLRREGDRGAASRALGGPGTLTWKPFSCGAFTPGAAALVAAMNGKTLAVVGLASRAEREKRKTAEEIFVGEIVVEAIPTARAVRFEAYSVFPPIDADLTFAHARTRPWGEIEAFVRCRGLAHLEAVRVVDRYEGPATFPKDQVKTTIRLRFRSAERTLEQEAVNREVRRSVTS